MFFSGLLICVCLLGSHAFSKSLPISRIKMFSSHGESSFKTIVNENDFYCDKTSFISKLESAGKFLKIWRPRQFGKTLVCDMLKEYYDKTNSQEKLVALFGQTDIATRLITEDKGKYLVLNFCFSNVSPDGDVEANFRNYINKEVALFSEKYHNAGQLKRPVVIDPINALSSLERLFDLVELSRQQIYLIVDEADSFANRLLLSVDTRASDSVLKQYETIVADRQSMLISWGNVIKAGTTRAIARAFFTGVVPQAFSDGLAGLDNLKDLTLDSNFVGLQEDVHQGLLTIS